MKTEHTAAPAGPAFQSIKDVENNVKVRMEKAIGDLQHEAATIRTGRATLSLLDHIRVDYYGTPSPLNQVARSEEHTSELQSLRHLVCRLLLEKTTRLNHTAPARVGATAASCALHRHPLR